MAKTAILSAAQLSDIFRGDDPPYPPMSACADEAARCSEIEYPERGACSAWPRPFRPTAGFAESDGRKTGRKSPETRKNLAGIREDER
jgi:hypothetical protein